MVKLKYKNYIEINKILKKYNFDAFEAVQNYGTFTGDHNLYKLIKINSLIDKVSNINGHIIEFGIWNGNTSFLIKKIIDLKKIKKKIFGVDHFKGLDKFSKKDGVAKKNNKTYVGKYNLIKDIIKFFNFKNFKIINENITTSSFKKLNKYKYCLVIIDVDLYEPTKAILNFINNKISKNGLIVFDEGNKKNWPGERKALVEFYKENKNKYELIRLNKNYSPDVILKKI